MKKVCLIGLLCLLLGTLVVPCGAISLPSPHYIYFESYDEYLDYIASATLPSDFVYYEDVCELGEFYSFFAYRDLSTYEYGFIDDKGNQPMLEIKTLVLNQSGTLTEDQIDPNDMSTANYTGTQDGIYDHDGILYKYINGGLSSILWKPDLEGSLCYELTGIFPGSGDFEETSAVGKLMNLDTAREMADLISAPYGRGVQDETTTADPSSESNDVETETIPGEVLGDIPEEIPTADLSVESSSVGRKNSVRVGPGIGEIAGIAIAFVAVAVGVVFGILSLKGRY